MNKQNQQRTTTARASYSQLSCETRRSGLRCSIFAASVAALLGLAFIPSPAHAATFTYSDGGATFNWGEGGNWVGGVAPGNGNDLVWVSGVLNPEIANNFPNPAVGVTPFVTSANSITFNASATLWNLGGGALTIGAGGITNNNVNLQTLSFVGTGITLGAGQTWNAAAGALNVTSNVALNGQTLTVTGANNTTLGGTVSGSGGLIKNGAGNLIVTNALTLDGGAALNAGTVTANGGLNVTGGSLTGTGTLAGSLNYTSTNGGFSTFGGAITGAGSTVTVNDELAGSGSGLNLSGANTYGGGTTVTSGFLGVFAGGTLGNGAVVVGSNATSTATLALSGGANIANMVTINGVGSANFAAGDGALYAFASTNSTVSGAVTVASNASVVADGGSTLTFTGGISNAASVLNFTPNIAGAGTVHVSTVGISGGGSVAVNGLTVNLNVGSTYTGGTTINSGTVNVNANNGAGTGTMIINAATGATQGLLSINGAGVTQNVSGLTIIAPSNGSGTTSVTGTGTLGLNGSLSLVNDTSFPGNGFDSTINVATIAMGAGNRAINVQGQNLAISDLTITSAITGTGGFTVNAAASTFNNAMATVELSGAAANTNTGLVTVNTGNLFINGPTFITKIAGDLTIGDGLADPVSGTLANSAKVTMGAIVETSSATNVTINADGQFDMDGFGQNIHNLVINSGNVTNVPANGTNSLALFGTLNMTGGSINGGTGATPGLQLFGGDVTATSDAAGNTATINSNVSLGAVTRTFTVNDGPAAVDLSITGVVQNASGIIKAGTGVMQLSAANTYSGGTTINSGVLAVGNASALGTGNVLVSSGTLQTFGGNHTIGVGGSYTENGGGTLRLQIGGTNAGINSDLLSVTGSAALSGTLSLVRINNFSPNNGDRVNIITDAGGHTGAFTTVTGDFNGLLRAVPQYNEALDVYILFQLSSFNIGGLTPNQKSVAQNLDLAGNDPAAAPLVNFLIGESLANLPHDYDLIAPEELAAIYEISISSSMVQNNNLQRRMDDIRAGSNGFCANGFTPQVSGKDVSKDSGGKVVLDQKQGPDVYVPTENNRWGVFINGTGDFVNVGDRDSNAPGYDITTGEFTLGVDYRLCDHFAIGIDAGYSSSRADLVANGKIDTDGGKIGAYATWFGKGFFGSKFYVDGVVGGGLNNYDTRRTGLQNILVNGDTDGTEFNAMISYGSDWTFGCFNIGTWSSVQFTNVNIDEFTETGSLAPLIIEDQDENSFRATTGVHASYDIKSGHILIRPEVRAAYQHEYCDSAYQVDSQLASGAGGIFRVRGPRIGRDAALVDAGVNVQWNNRLATYVYYDGVLGRNNYDNNAITGGLRFGF